MNTKRLDELTADFMATPTEPGGDLSFLGMAELCLLQIERIAELEQLPTTKPEATPIDLSAFCSTKGDVGTLSGMARPFQIANESWLYATNAIIAVRTRASPVVEPETVGHVPLSVGDMPWGGDSDKSWEKWPALEWSSNLQKECPQCGDTGRDADCKACLGSGRWFFQRVGEYRIQSHYDLLIRDLPDLCWRPATNTLIAFRFTGCEGLVSSLDDEKEASQ